MSKSVVINVNLEQFNPHHDKMGRFASGSGKGGGSATGGEKKKSGFDELIKSSIDKLTKEHESLVGKMKKATPAQKEKLKAEIAAVKLRLNHAKSQLSD